MDDDMPGLQSVHSSRPETPAISIVASEDLMGADMSVPVETPAQRRAARDRIYKQEHRKKRKALRAATAKSPFKRKAHPKSIPTHRMLPPQTVAFDAATSETSGGGAWSGPQPPPTKNAQGKRKSAAAALKEKRLTELHTLLQEQGYKYIAWDGKYVLKIYMY